MEPNKDAEGSRRQVLYFGELDPLSGSYPQEKRYLHNLVRELLINLLFSDVVILPPGNFTEHALTLPAFEQLTPFVHSGFLGTSVDPRRILDPSKFISDRIEQALDAEPASRRGTLGARRRSGLQEFDARQLRLWLRDVEVRFRDLVPSRPWPIVRDITAQVSGFTNTLTTALAKSQEEGLQAAHELDVLMQRLLDAGITVDRNVLFARLSAIKGKVSPPDLAKLVNLIQIVFLKEGGSHRWSAGEGDSPQEEPGIILHLYPGGYARRLSRLRTKIPGAPDPPFAWSLDVQRIRRRLKLVGYELNALLDLPVDRLFELRQSPEWKTCRTILQAELFFAEEAKSFVRPLLKQMLPDARAHRRETVTLPPLLIPAPWQLAYEAEFGSHNTVLDGTEQTPLILHCQMRALYDPVTNQDHALGQRDASWLMLLVERGDVGITWKEVVLLDDERFAIERPHARHPGWPRELKRPLGTASKTRHENWRVYVEEMKKLRHSVDAASRDLNRTLKKYDLVIEAKNCWRLTGDRPIRLYQSPWDRLDDLGQPPLSPAAYLDEQLSRLFKRLAEAYPQAVHIHELVAVLGSTSASSPDDYTRKKLSALKRELKAHEEAVILLSDRKDLFCLAPRRLPTQRPG